MFRWIITHEKMSSLVFKTVREMIEGQRRYVINGKDKITLCHYNIVSDSKPRSAIVTGGENEGEEEATRIVDQSGARGTAMHKILEKYIEKVI